MEGTVVMGGGWRYSGDGGWVKGTVVMEGGWRYSGDGGWVEGTVVIEGGWRYSGDGGWVKWKGGKPGPKILEMIQKDKRNHYLPRIKHSCTSPN